MTTHSSLVVGFLSAIVLAGSPVAADDRNSTPAPNTTSTAASAATTSDEEAAQTRRPIVYPVAKFPPGQQGRWGFAIGLQRLAAVAAFDHRNAVTPLANTSPPYTGGLITIDHTWSGKYFSFGYRGPFHRGGHAGFGLELQLSDMGEDLPDEQAVGASSTNVPVVFSTVGGGIVDQATLAGAGQLSYNLGDLTVWAGVKLASLRVKSGAGSYQGVSPAPPNPPQFFDNGEDRTFRLRTVNALIGAEYFLFSHGSLEFSVDLLPEKIDTLADAPWTLSYRRKRISPTTAFRIFF
jgi:hypothetical protein